MSDALQHAGHGLPMQEALAHSVVHIRTAGGWSPPGAGTGFFYVADFGDGRTAFLVVTNKHVIEGAGQITITLPLSGEDGRLTPGPGIDVTASAQEVAVTFHPDPMVDLAAFDISMFVDKARQATGREPFLMTLDASMLPTSDNLAELEPYPPVIVAGFPTAFRDIANNAPILRRGHTATNVRTDFEGRAEFLVDMAVFPGASGSPVILLEEGGFLRGNRFTLGRRTMLLGVIFATFQTTAKGVVSKAAPTRVGDEVEFKQIINLGACLKAHRIAELVQEIRRVIDRPQPRPLLSFTDPGFSV